MLKYFLDTNELNWLQLLFQFLLLMNVAALVFVLKFSIHRLGCMLNLSRIEVLRERLQLDSKIELTSIEIILQLFVWNVPCFVNL